MINPRFNPTPEIFAKGFHLIGSNKLSANLSHAIKRLCSTCKNDMGKNNWLLFVNSF